MDIKGIITGVSGLIILVLVFLLAKRFGLIFKPSKVGEEWEDTIFQEMKAEKEIMNTRYLDPNFWRESNKTSVSANVLQDFAKRLDDAFGAWYTGGDDEAEIFAVFEEINSPYVLSMVADQFGKMFKQSLRQRLIDQLDTSELNQLWLIINKYKK